MSIKKIIEKVNQTIDSGNEKIGNGNGEIRGESNLRKESNSQIGDVEMKGESNLHENQGKTVNSPPQNPSNP